MLTLRVDGLLAATIAAAIVLRADASPGFAPPFRHARYDRAVTTFAPDGSLLQVDYAVAVGNRVSCSAKTRGTLAEPHARRTKQWCARVISLKKRG